MKITKRSTALIKLAQDGSKLSYCSDELKMDRELVLIAVKNNGIALLSTPSFYNDLELITEAVKTNGYVLSSLDESFRADKALALLAVTSSPMVVAYLSEELQDDDEIAKIAVDQNGEAMEFLSQRLKCDIELAMTAVNNNWEAIQFVDPVLYKNKPLQLAAINGFLKFIEKYNYYLFSGFDFADLYNEWLGDREIAILLSKYISISNLPDNLKLDKELILMLLKESPYEYRLIAPELFKDKEIALKVIEFGINPANLFAFVADELKNDKDIITKLIENYPSYYKKLSKQYKDDHDIAMLAISLEGNLYSYLPTKFRNNKEVLLSAIQSKNPLNPNSIPPQFNQLDDIRDAIKSSQLARAKELNPNMYFLEDYLHLTKPETIEYTDYQDGGKLKSIKPATITPVKFNDKCKYHSKLLQPHQLKFTCLGNYSDERYHYIQTNIAYQNLDYNNFSPLTPFRKWDLEDILECKFVTLKFRYPPFSIQYDFYQKLKEHFKRDEEYTLDIISVKSFYHSPKRCMLLTLELAQSSVFYDSIENSMNEAIILLEGFIPDNYETAIKFAMQTLGINLVEYTAEEIDELNKRKEIAAAEENERKRLSELRKAKMITREMRIEIVKMVNEGMSHRQIAKVFEVDHTTIIRHYKKALTEK